MNDITLSIFRNALIILYTGNAISASDTNTPRYLRTVGEGRGDGHATRPDAVRALVVCAYAKQNAPGEELRRYKQEETESLAGTLGLEVVHSTTLLLSKPSPSVLIGGGMAETLKARAEEEEAELCVFGCLLTPIQQRNLEKTLGMKVIDRTALILEIFAARASTAEGRLQTELAAQEYLKTRLVRSWTHLERQRGGKGFLGGPGERQIESDRRAIRERIAVIKKKLDKTVRTRRLHRKKRQDVPYKIVALAGYTNAGKSTLFNALTAGGAVAEDKLFATLDPKIRPVSLPGGRTIMLADTVGFISDLPTELVAAFRATLEEVSEADVVLHVRDAASPMAIEQKADVEHTLSGLIDMNMMQHSVMEVMNKADLLPPLPDGAASAALYVSALSNSGMDALKHALANRLAEDETAYRVTLPVGNGDIPALLHTCGTVRNTAYEEDGSILIDVLLTDEAAGKIRYRCDAAGGTIAEA